MIAGRYSLDQEIGRGGMGAVWRGTDHNLDRTVALKRVGHAPGGADTDVQNVAVLKKQVLSNPEDTDWTKQVDKTVKGLRFMRKLGIR